MTQRARLTVLAALLPLAALSARADTRFDFLFRAESVGDDTQLFLHLAVRDQGVDRAALEPVLPRIRHVETDLPVILFLSRHSGRPPAAIVELRALGLEWQVIFGRVGVPVDLLFGGIDRDPGPPYGNAWGYWKKNPRGVRLADADVFGLVEIQLGTRLTGLSAFDLSQERSRGRGVVVVVAEKKGRPWKASKGKESGPPGVSGKPKEKGPKGKGKGKGN